MVSLFSIQVDAAVIMAMSDNELEFYLPAYGDRIAIKTFLRTHGHVGVGVAEDAFSRPVLNRLRQKIAERKRKSGKAHQLGESASRPDKLLGNSNAARDKRRIEVGWHDFDTGYQTYKQVRSQYGGGIRHLSLSKGMAVEDIMQVSLKLFFPDGKNRKGDIDDFEFEIRNADGSSVGQCTIGELYERLKVKMLRLNIFSRKKTYAQSTVSTERSPVVHLRKHLVLHDNNRGSTTSATDDCKIDDTVSILSVHLHNIGAICLHRSHSYSKERHIGSPIGREFIFVGRLVSCNKRELW